MPSSSDHTRHGYSKAQICFFKIPHLISSLPPSHNPTPESSTTAGIAIDLNFQFGSYEAGFQCNSDGNGVDQTGQQDAAAKASVQVGVSDDGVHNEKTKIEAEIREEDEEDEREDNEGFVQNENKNRLDLLIDAASVVSGEQESEIEEVKDSWMVVKLYDDDDTEERSPVVRSKRGRSQALPYRFRDSVMEQLKCTRPHRPSSTTSASRKRFIILVPERRR